MKQQLIAAGLTLLLGTSAVQAQSPKRELRSCWLTTVWAIDWPSSTDKAIAQKQMTQYLDALERHNFTGVCFQVRGTGDAMYKSSYEPWSHIISGTRGVDPGWDPLQFVVNECHKRGMECYAWVNPYRESQTSTPNTTPFDKDWQARGWLLSNSSCTIFDPSNPDARAHILNVIREIYTNYSIDGMLFDDYFYPSGGLSETNTAPDWKKYKDSGTTLSIGDWRRKNINDFMHEIYEQIQQDRPDMRFGISPAGIADKSAWKYGLARPDVQQDDWQYSGIYSDPLAWMAEKSLDFISPQIYWTTTERTAPFGVVDKWWSEVAEKFGCHFYCSHSLSFLAEGSNNSAGWADVAAQVALHRKYQTSAAPGEIFYSTKNIDGIGTGGVAGLGDHLEQKVYQRKSLVPRITWKKRMQYDKPNGIVRNGSTLRWQPAKRDDAAYRAIVRYTVYAIPSEINIDDAMSTDGDGIKGDYLLAVTYNPFYLLSDDLKDGYYYAVCVYDGYGYESEPALEGYDGPPAGIADVEKNDVYFDIKGNRIVFDDRMEFIKVFTLAGALVANAENTDTIVIPATGHFCMVTPQQSVHILISE